MIISQDMPLLSTLAIGLTAAFLMGLIAARLRLSPIVGYLIAGILVGPFTPGLVADMQIAEELAEVGIVLLMFGVGLHFSPEDLLEVRKIAVPGAIVQILAATALGTYAASTWGWPPAGGVLLGLALSVASTVVLLRALAERNAIETINGHIAVGWLIVEDLAMVLALVMIPPLAGVAGNGQGGSAWVGALLPAIGKAGVFALFMLVAGKRLLPWLLALVTRTGSRELFTLAVFAVAIGTAYGAAVLFDISFALGAFFGGMMLKGSSLVQKVTDNILPFQDAFAVLFFVSVGMLFDPGILLERSPQVFTVVLIILLGKSLAAFLIVLLFRYPVDTALVVSASLAQIGEFSFILAELGRRYDLLPGEGYSLILAGAIISIALNPLMFKLIDIVFGFIADRPHLVDRFTFTRDALRSLERRESHIFTNLVVLVGYGRVGRYICQNLQQAGFDLVVIDYNRERVQELRREGIHAIAGDATDRDVLTEASIESARAIILAVPSPFEAEQIIEISHSLNPDIQVLVRVHDSEEKEYFETKQVNLAVMGPQEVAKRMADFLIAPRA